MPRNEAYDFHIVVSQPKWRRFGSTAKARSPCWPADGNDIHTPQLYQAERGASRGWPRQANAGRGRPREAAKRGSGAHGLNS